MKTNLTKENRIAQLLQNFNKANLQPLWTLESDIMPHAPKPKSIPWLWKWEELYELATEAGELITLDRGGDRRAIALANPGLGGMPFATETLWAAVQWLNGKEVAPAHRHSAQAIRFIIDGAGSYSTVEGDKVYLEKGDLVLNPPLLWHDHGSDSDKRAIWIDGLDIPLTKYLNASFFEHLHTDKQEVATIKNYSILKYGAGTLKPAWERQKHEYPPISTFKWAKTEEALLDLAKSGSSSPYDDIAMEYINPHSGNPVMKTFSCWIQMLRPNVHTQAHRQVCSTVYFVFEGSGYSVIDGVRFDWNKGDLFAVPNWKFHEHINTSGERAILFSINDRPTMELLDKYREEAIGENGGRQKITSTFNQSK
jgi:gentisate 1,2-dioxygenase